MRLAFIGGGTMAEAILKGVLAAKLAGPTDISVGELVAARRDLLTGEYGVVATDDNLEAINGADLVVLAIKPQDLPSLFDQLKGKLSGGQTAVSIIAGAKISTLSQGMDHQAVIRVMPNTPAQIGEGMSFWTCSKEVGEQARVLVKSVLDTVGREVYVDDEKYLDMATAVSGSGPAYVFLIIEALIDAGVYVGLPREAARRRPANNLWKHQASDGKREASRRTQSHGCLSGRDHRRGPAGLGTGRGASSYRGCSKRRISKVD